MSAHKFLLKALVFTVLITLIILPNTYVFAAGLTWPTGQVLPSFSTPVTPLDLMDVSYTKTYKANSAAFAHPTGHLDGDGSWLCQCGIDAVGYMIDGPNATDIPTGTNIANFHLYIDNNTYDNNVQVTCYVVDKTNGATLASMSITRQQFTAANTWQDFNLTYNNTTAGHQIAFKIYWHGGAYIKTDYISTTSKQKREECLLFTTLKGLVNKTQPRIWSYNGDEEGKYNWLNALGLSYTGVSDNWSLVTKYKSSISGIVVYDDTQIDTMNLATTIASIRNGVVAAPSLVSKLTAAPYSLPILVDLRGQFTSKTAVYQNLYNNYWSQVTHKLIMGINPQYFYGHVRDYAAAVGAACVWLDPRVSAEKTILDQFLSGMPAGTGIYMGWWPEEASGITEASLYGVSTCASDWSENLTVFGGASRTVNVKPIANKPPLNNKIYVTLILSDGDNLQYMEHRFKVLWDSSNRGQVPLGWTVSPAMLDAMPGVLNYLYNTAKANDCLIAGPSGVGYTYPNYWTNQSYLDSYIRLSNDYMNRAGLKVCTIWNTISGGINVNVGNSFADNAPSLLGLTAQNAGGSIAIYNNLLPSQGLNATYCYSEASMISEINNAISGWSGTSPRFVAIQEQPWNNITYQNFVNVVNNFSSNSNIVFVRPDNYFQLMREYNCLPVDTATILKRYEAENEPYAASPFSHSVGRADGDGWSANTSQDSPNLMLWGPYDATLPVGTLTATFKMLVDNNTVDNYNVVKLDVRDNVTGTLLAARDITRQQFTTPNVYQDFSLSFNNATAGHALEFRVYYYDTSYVKIDKVTVTTNIRKYEAEGSVLSHSCGRVDGDGWSANTTQDAANFLIWGPYEKLPVGDKKVTFRMKVDNNTLNNQNVALIDIRDNTTGATLASATITRNQFTAANTYQDFSLTFNNTVYSHPLEYRVYYYKTAKLTVDKITVN